MSEPSRARPVSGEIMTAATPAPEGFARAADVIDVEYETLVDAPDSRMLPRTEADRAGSAFAGMSSLRQAAQAGAAATRGGPVFWGVGLSLVLSAFWVSGGHALLRDDVGGSSAYIAPATLRIVDVSTSVIGTHGRPVLKVDGAAVNEGNGAAMLPGIEISVAGHDGRVTRYKLGTSDRPLPAGQRFDFSSRLEVPKDGVKSVAVSFREGSTNAGGEG